LHLYKGDVALLTADAWAALRSLRELQLDKVLESKTVFSTLSSFPALRLLRWRCRVPKHPPSWQGVPCVLPPLESLRVSLTAAPLVQLELLLPRVFEEWCQGAEWMRIIQRGVWDELHQLPSQLPRRVRIVALEPKDEE